MENLPVILLKGLVLLPHNEIRLEFDDEASKSLIEISTLFHDDHIVVVNNFNSDSVDFNCLPKIGILGIIKNKLLLPNGKTRLTIKGKYRVNINEYYKIDNIIEANTSEIKDFSYDVNRELAYLRKIYHELEDSIMKNPNISNSILPLITDINSLDKITDLIAPYLPINKKRLCDYANQEEIFLRADMILADISKEMQIFEIEKDIDNKIKQELDNNQKEYILKEKLKIIKAEIGDQSLKEEEVKKLKFKLSNAELPLNIYKRLNNEINRYSNMSDLSPEVSVVRKYIDYLLKLPWNLETTDLTDLNQIRNNLAKTHFGLEEVKVRILEYLAVKQMSSNVNSPIICLVGPPGVGKTTLAASIARSINRKFVKVSMAGVNDEADILGHTKSYIGASPGKIISGMIRANSKNPVFLIDEIDKMTKSYKGDPANCLLEVLDYHQNNCFSDNYIEEEFDLSKVMFILTANNIEDIPLALKDRLEIIEVKGYTEYEKVDIAKNYLLPKICKNHGIMNVNMKDSALFTIIRKYTKEAGVRELERMISKIIRKITTVFVEKNQITDKIVVDKSDLEEYLGNYKYENTIRLKKQIGIVNGLSCTTYGGDILPIEVNFYKGKGKLILTGSLGKVIKESATVALSYIKANYKKFNINYETLTNNDIHIHIPSGGVEKEGPSAGVALITSLISAFSNLKINNDIAMTGEVTLRGNILPVGGIKEKSMGAISNNIKVMFIPEGNIKDIETIPVEIKNKIKYIPVKNYMDIYNSLELRNE